MESKTRTYRAAAIGHTSRGDYGHDIDMSIADISGVELVAIADPDETGRGVAQDRTGAPRAYADYRTMLERERPDLVLICPRWCDQRTAMILACIEAGVRGIYCEKPFAASLREADALREACRAADVRLVVAHKSRENPYLQWARNQLENGELGRLEVMRAHGKCDRRAGGMDLAVLGPHVFDHMCYLAGPPLWVFGSVTQEGRAATRRDAYAGEEGVGLIAGDRISAMFGFENGVTGYYESFPGDRAGSRWFGIELHCARSILALRSLPRGEAYRYPYGLWMPGTADGTWEPFTIPEWANDSHGIPRESRVEGGWFHRECNRRHVLSLLRWIEDGVPPRDTTTIDDVIVVQEMISGIYASHLAGARLPLPLADRADPLS